jgi:protein O-mannosyl-transferase
MAQAALGCAVLAAFVAIVFQSSRHGALLDWDDNINITGNPHLAPLNGDSLRWMFTDVAYMRRYVPLAWLDWAVERVLFGLTAASTHWGNIVFHSVNSVLVFLLVRDVLTIWLRNRGRTDPNVAVAGWLGASVWAVHPLRVEVVAWSSGRIYCQSAFFLFLATLAYLRAADPARVSRGRVRWRVAAWVAFTASLLTYPLAVSYIAVFFVIDGWLFRRFSPAAGARAAELSGRTVWLEKVPFAIAVVAVLAVTIAARFQPTAMWPPAPTLANFGVFDRLMQAAYIWAYYLWKPFLPLDLAPVYVTLVAFNPISAVFVGSAAAVVGITVGLVWQRHRWPAALALWLCHLVILVPVLGLTEHPHYSNDRYSYLQGVVWSLAIAGAMVHGSARRFVLGTTIGAVLVACVALSVAQISIWRDNETLFRFLYAKVGATPYRSDLSLRLGDELRTQSRFAEAKTYYDESLQWQPKGTRAAYAYWGVGKIAQRQGDLAAATAAYRHAHENAPSDVDVLIDLGAVLAASGEPAQAVPLLERARALDPLRADACLALAAAYAGNARRDEAVAAVREALRLNPNLAGAREMLARFEAP